MLKCLMIIGVASLASIASAAATGAQDLARRVSAVRDGKVRMTFAAREDLCGYGNGISTKSDTHSRTTWDSKRSEDVEYDEECSEGPVRLVATVRDGSIERLKAYVGGRWRPAASGVTDLGMVSTRQATDFLMRIASTQSGKVAEEAIFPVTIADSVSMAQPLYQLARNESRPDGVRDQAVFWLSQLPDERAVDLLEEILRTARTHKIQEKAIFALSQHRSGRGMATLREYAERESAPESLRGTAIFWLGQKRHGNHEYLRGLYSRVRSDELKDKVIFALSQQRGVGNDEWLMELAARSSEPVEMRKKALFWAGQTGAPVSRLANVYSRTREPEIKEHLIFVLSQRRETASIDKLMDIARNDPDREMRKKAMFWLGQSRDARVAAFLADMINR